VASDYSWVHDPWGCKVGVAGCITTVTDASVEEAILAFGGDPTAPTQPWESASRTGDPVAAVVPTEGAVVVVENNGFEGSRSEVLRPLSRHGRAGSVYWNVNDHMRVSFAESGRLLCAFDPVAPQQRWGDDPARVEPILGDLDRSPAAWVASGMLAVERFTGVAVSPQLVAALDEVHVLVPVLEDMRPAPPLEYHPLRLVDPGLLETIGRQPADRLRQLAEWVAAEAVAATGLDRDPAIAEATGGFVGTGPATLPADAAAAVRRLEAESRRAGTRDSGGVDPVTREAWRRGAAAEALRAATNEDSLAAALGAVNSARLASPDLLRRIRARLDEG
jgi:Family of unknown function (DUF6461)